MCVAEDTRFRTDFSNLRHGSAVASKGVIVGIVLVENHRAVRHLAEVDHARGSFVDCEYYGAKIGRLAREVPSFTFGATSIKSCIPVPVSQRER